MKWLAPLAMAVVAIGSCSEAAGDKDLLSDPGAAVEAATEPSSTAAAVPEASTDDIPAGAYTLDPAHSTLIFSASHLGFSNYTAQFNTFAAELQLEPANPGTAVLIATVDPASLHVPAPPAGFLDDLKGEKWIDAPKFPQITFKSTHVAVTGKNSADVTGDLTLRGVTRPITLRITYNGGYAGHVAEPNARIGFSAMGMFKRSDFNIDYGIPAPGSSMGVSDEVSVRIEAEFIGPPWKDALAPAPG